MFLQETQDPSAALWLDEIQDAILKANQDTQEALQCKSKHKHFILLRNAFLSVCLVPSHHASVWVWELFEYLIKNMLKMSIVQTEIMNVKH